MLLEGSLLAADEVLNGAYLLETMWEGWRVTVSQKRTVQGNITGEYKDRLRYFPFPRDSPISYSSRFKSSVVFLFREAGVKCKK